MASKSKGSEKVSFKGGPFDGQKAYMTMGSTLDFEVKDFKGKYVRETHWGGSVWKHEAKWVSNKIIYPGICP